MERKPEDYYRTVRGTLFKRSDLREIVDILSSGEGIQVDVESESHKFKDVDELIAFNEPIRKISFTRNREKWSFRYGHVYLEATEATISMREADDSDVGVATRLEALFIKRRRWLYPSIWFYFATVFAVPFFVGATTVIFRDELRGHTSALRTVAAIGLLFSLTGVAVWLLSYFRGKAIRFRREKGEQTTINVRAGVWAVVLLAVGAILKEIAGAIANHFNPPPVH